MNEWDRQHADEVEVLQRQLSRVNADFEEFVSLAAHNMREPLRDVASYSDLLAESQASRPDPEASLFLEHIRKGAEKMRSLLAELVDYSAVGAAVFQPSVADMEAVLRQVLLRADAEVVARHVVITHDPLPAVTGDADLLAKVLCHLLRNAIAYCGEAIPRVHISCRQADSGWLFSVADNGPGIDPEFKERIFGVFKRLHGQEYPGNGLGLAFCRRAIEWQRGRIWLESKSEQGATFCFTLLPAESL